MSATVYIFVSWLFTLLSADCLLFVSCLFGGIRVQNQLISAVYLHFCAKILVFPRLFYRNVSSCLFTFSAVCLLFRQLIVYFFVSWLFTFVSCLFTLWIFAPKLLFFPSVFCQNNDSKLDICQRFVYIFSCLFTFSSADCLLLSAVCLLFCQLIMYNLNFRAKNLVFPWLFCHYRCFNTLIVNKKKFNFLPFFNFFNFSQTLEGFFKIFFQESLFSRIYWNFSKFLGTWKKNGHDSSLYSRKSFNYGACDVDYSINTK